MRISPAFAALLVIVSCCLGAQVAYADSTFTVTNQLDTGTGTLRWALTQPCTGVRTVNFEIHETTIQLQSTLTITGIAVIAGVPNINVRNSNRNGFRVTISGGGSVRPFTVTPGASLRLENLTVSNGSSTEGGAIRNEGSLRIVRSLFLNNAATLGGAIYNSGTTVLNSCTFSENSASRGGALYNAGGSARLQYVTACANSASELGGVLYADGGSNMVHRSILWGNPASACATPPYSTQIGDVNSATVSVTQTIIEGGYPGVYIPTGDSFEPIVLMPNNLDIDPVLAPLDYPPFPYLSPEATNILISTKSYYMLPGSPAVKPIKGFSSDRFADTDDGYDQRGADDRSRSTSAGPGALYEISSSLKLGAVHDYAGSHSSTSLYNEVWFETNTTQSAAILTPFKTIRFSVASWPNPPPATYASGKIYFHIPAGTNGPSCIIEPNPATIAEDNTVTVTPVANGYFGGYTVYAQTRYHPPYETNDADCLTINLYNNKAAAVTVTNDATDGFGSLDWAAKNTLPSGLITFDRDHTIRLANYLNVYSSIDGGTNRIVISGDQRTPVMQVWNSATIRNVTIADGLCTWAGFGGGVTLLGGDVTFENVVFRNNRGIYGGAIGVDSVAGEFTLGLNLINCLFFGNVAEQRGGALYAVETDGEVRAVNCTFAGNSARLGGVINNWSVGVYSGLHETFANCIFRDNTAEQYPVIQTTRLMVDNSVTFSNCNVQGAFISNAWDTTLGIDGGGNIATNPLFVAAASSNYCLSAGSPCINSGHNAAVPTNITVDLAGLPRISDGTVDMGAYETPVVVTVRFNGNGGTPSTVTSNYIEGVSFGVLPSATRAGYTFTAWTNVVGGTVATTTLVVHTMTNLYARWTANAYTVTLDKQSGSGGSNAVTATYASAMPTATAPTRTGYAFAGYWDATSGGTQYYSAAMASLRTWDKATTATLYARWMANTYTVTFDKQGGTGGSNTVTATYSSAMPVATASARTGYSFGGYWDAISGGTQYYSAAMASLRAWDKAAATTLYARWTANAYTVTYNGNASTDGATTNSLHTYGTASSLTLYGFARRGFAFTGWNTTADGSGTAYADGASILNLTTINSATVTLYAQWAEVTIAPLTVGTASDGMLLVSGTNIVDNFKTKLTANGSRGQTVISVASSAGFGVGDEVLILCMQGTGAGSYEFATVGSVAGGQITLNASLQNSFNVAGGARVMVQRVPNYLDVTVRSNGVLTASAWTGGAASWTPGGVVAFRVKRSFTIETGGRVTADALGFDGGAGVISVGSANGYQGESYNLNVGAQSREPNSGGGGGGLYFSTTGDSGGGGGGGGHGTAGTAGANVEPYHGLGGTTYGNTNMTTLFLGSGGGAGGTDDDGGGSSKGGNGGRGGGIVYIAAHTLMIEGGLSAAGGEGETVQDTDGDADDESGGGGGGSGGTVVLSSAVRPVLTAAVLVPGGSGGGVESGSMLGGVGGTGIVAYESTSGSTTNGITWAWLLKYGLATDGSADLQQSDTDTVNNLQEYIADTDPTNSASYFCITDISNSPTTTVSFVSSAGRAYTLIGVTNLSSSAWLPVPGAGPRLGIGGADALSDTNLPPKGPFYKLQVELP